MAYTTGTATNYSDLLDKLRAYLVSQGWTTLSYTAGTVSGGGGSLFTRGPGAGSDKRVFVEIRTESNVALSFYGWRLRGATGYTSGAPEGANPGAQPTPCYFNLWASTISYWFFANDRRFIVVAKVGAAYISLYAGFFLPWSVPDGYPFPLYIAGNYRLLADPNIGNAANRMFTDPGGQVGSSSGWIRTSTGVWVALSNHEPSTQTDNGNHLGRVQIGYVWPQSCGESAFSQGYTQLGGAYNNGTGMWDNLVPTRQNEYALFPTQIHMALDVPQGALDGAYHVAGSGLSAEQQITIGGRTFRVFQNISRSSGNDFMAIEEI